MFGGKCTVFDFWGEKLTAGKKGNDLGPNIHIDFEKCYKTSTFYFPLLKEF